MGFTNVEATNNYYSRLVPYSTFNKALDVYFKRIKKLYGPSSRIKIVSFSILILWSTFAYLRVEFVPIYCSTFYITNQIVGQAIKLV